MGGRGGRCNQSNVNNCALGNSSVNARGMINSTPMAKQFKAKDVEVAKNLRLRCYAEFQHAYPENIGFGGTGGPQTISVRGDAAIGRPAGLTSFTSGSWISIVLIWSLPLSLRRDRPTARRAWECALTGHISLSPFTSSLTAPLFGHIWPISRFFVIQIT